MNTRELQRSMYELEEPSQLQRLTLAVFLFLWVVLAWWVLFGGGVSTLYHWFGGTAELADPIRRMCLAVALSVYFVRILFTEFVFLKRGIAWSEVFTIAPWTLIIYLLLALAGGANQDPFQLAGVLGIFLFVIGSWANSYSEYSRYRWKQQPSNQGHLYTLRLFRYSRHPNYFGDLLSFTGLCLISGNWLTAIVPVLMLAGFVFVNIPVLDSHLRDKYGVEFVQYAERTRKLIPFIY
jgi:protein-S-isoprenylcysteine O-methyltransferase Ste14